MRDAILALGTIAAVLFSQSAQAQGKPLPPPASDVMPPVELRIGLTDGKATCMPAELPLPADTNVELHLISTASQPVTITMEGQFEKGHVLHADGDVGHVASEKGYTIKANGKATIRVRTLPPGEVAFACTSTGNQSEPFKGKAILTKPAG